MDQTFGVAEKNWDLDVKHVKAHRTEKEKKALWRAFEMKTRLAEKFTDQTGVKVTNEDGFCLAA